MEKTPTNEVKLFYNPEEYVKSFTATITQELPQNFKTNYIYGLVQLKVGIFLQMKFPLQGIKFSFHVDNGNLLEKYRDKFNSI